MITDAEMILQRCGSLLHELIVIRQSGKLAIMRLQSQSRI